MKTQQLTQSIASVFFLAACFVAITLAAQAGPPPAANITWGSAHNITGDSDVSTLGSLLYAYNIGASGVTATTVNGVTFSPYVFPFDASTTTTTTGSVTFTETPGYLVSYNNLGAVSGNFAALSADYQTLLSSAGGGDIPPTLTGTFGGLTIGNDYLIQWWFNYSSYVFSGYFNQTQASQLGGNSTVTLDSNVSNSVGGLGQYAIGTFTATSSSVAFDLNGVGFGRPLINAFQLRASSNPTLYWLGSNGTLWTAANNWSSNATGTSPENFTAGSDIVFSATGSSNETSTNLGGDQTIASLTINATGPVGISGGNLTVSGDISVGSSSSNNSLQISNGVAAGATSMWAGSEVGANNNQLTVGANATLTLTDDIYVGGNGSSNRLTITNGGAVSAFYMSAGREAGSNDNQVTVGANATLAVTDLIDVGFHGSSNNLTITNGGAVSANYTSAGRESGSNNNAILVTSDASMLINNDLFVGEAGSTNSMTVSERGRVTSSVGYIGKNATSANNTVTVTGTNSTWTNNGTLHVGYQGSNNTLTVANSGTVTASSISIASQAGSGGTLNIGTFGGSDTGGTINAPSIAFGNGTAAMNLNLAGNTTVSADLLGGTANSTLNQLGTGTTTLTSANSTYAGKVNVNAGTLAVSGSLNGTSSLDLNSGSLAVTGSVTTNGSANANSGTITIGQGGSLVVSGSTPIYQNTPSIFVSNAIGGFVSEFDVQSGQFLRSISGNMSFPNDVAIDSSGFIYVVASGVVQKYSSNGTFLSSISGNMSGPNGLVINGNGTLYVSNSSGNTVSKYSSNGTYLSSISGNMSGPTGMAIDGNGTLYVANYGDSTVSKYSSDGTFLGSISGNMSGPFGVEVDGSGTVYAPNYSGTYGDTVSKYSSNGTFLGSISGNMSQPVALRVDGNGTLYVANFLGAYGDTVSKYSSNGTFLGAISGNMSGPSGLAFGNYTQEILVPAGLTLAASANDTATLNLGTFGGNDTTATLTTPFIAFGNGTAAFNLNLAGNTTVSSDLLGGNSNSTINQLGTGTTTLTSANSTYAGAITVNAGTLTVTSSLANATTQINSGGTLTGNGTLGAVTINSGGTIAPGNSPGTITVGNLTLNGGSIYNWQTSSINGTAGTDWDLIASAGTLTLNATSGNPITISLSTLGSATLAGVKNASWQIGNFTSSINGFDASAFTFNSSNMTGTAGGYFLSLGSGNTTLLLNYKTAATWNTATGNWSTAAQWDGGSLPSNGDAIEFSGSGGVSTNNSFLNSASGLTFLAGAGSYTVNGSALTLLGEGIVNDSANTQTLALDLTLGANQTFATNTANLIVSGAISGNASLTKAGNKTLTLLGSNTYTGGTTVSSGILAGTTTGLQGAIANNAVVNFDQAFNGTYAGAMSGTGSLIKSGAGVVLLSGNNSYSGGTTINSGVLAASVVSGNLVTLNRNAFGSGSVNINAGGAMFVPSTTPVGPHLSIGGDLTLNNGTIAFYDIGTSPAGQDLRIDVAGNFTNAGGGVVFDFSQVEALGAGNYTLVSYNGTNFATNAISLRAGVGTTLQGSFSVNGSSLVYTVLGAQSSGTDIQNNGGPNTPIVSNYTINQTGVVTIGENNMVAALTFNSGGTLNIQSNGVLNVSSGTLNVQSGSSVVGGGTLVAPAGLNKDGTGELDFTNNVVVTGTAAVNAGLLSVNGQLQATGGVVVNPNATLGGAGLIVGNVNVKGGNISPGNSPGTLSVAGNLVLTGANATIIEIESPTNYDRIVVSGQATLGGTLNAVAYGGGTITPGARYDFLQAGSIIGEFDSLVAPEGLRVRFLNSGTVGTLLFGPGSYVPMAINQNQRSVAKALDSFIVATDGNRLAVSIALDSLTTEQFPAAFDQIMPGFYESLADIAIEQAFNQTQMLNQRISSVRLGAAGFQAIGGITQPLVHDKNGKSAAEAKDANPIVESATATNWNAWALGTGMFSRTTNLGSVDNYNNDAGGFLVGADYRWSENFVTGLYAGYDYSYAEYNGGGSTKGNSFSFGTYASYEKDGYYADAVIGGGYTGFQTQRSIEFSTIDRTASADPNSGQFTAGLNLGKDFEVGKFTLGPIVGAQYTYAGIGSFTESGAESLDLSLGQQNANSLRSTLGGRVAYTWNLNQKIALIPEVRMFWQHEFLNNPRNISASLDGGSGPSFGYETTDPYRNSVFAGAGVTAQFGKNLSGSVFYNINFGSQTYQSNMVSAGLNVSF